MSNFVWLYQALDAAGQSVKLNIYEDIPHVLQIKAPQSPEAVTALKKMDDFLTQHLEK